MSVARPNGTKILLPRSGPDQFWQLIHDHFAGEDARKWKYLAMLALRENAGWPLDRIGNVFGHPKGHVTRCLARIKGELRQDFDASPEFLDLDDEMSWELEKETPDDFGEGLGELPEDQDCSSQSSDDAC